MVISANKTALLFTLPKATLSMNGSYAILIDRGAVVGLGCSFDGPPTPGISSPQDWGFHVGGICSTGYYLDPPYYRSCVGKRYMVKSCNREDSTKLPDMLDNYMLWQLGIVISFSNIGVYFCKRRYPGSIGLHDLIFETVAREESYPGHRFQQLAFNSAFTCHRGIFIC